MLDFADFVAINKFDRKGAQDALRDVAKQYQRNRELWSKRPEDMPVYGTQASRFNDDGVTALYQGLLPRLAQLACAQQGKLVATDVRHSSGKNVIVPPARRYLAEIADTVRGYHRFTRSAAGARAPAAQRSQAHAGHRPQGRGLRRPDRRARRDGWRRQEAAGAMARHAAAYAGDEYVVKIRDKEIRTRLCTHAVRHAIRKVALPRFEDHGEILRWLMLENVPGSFPTPPACSRSSAKAKTRPACSPARATPSAPTAASSWSRRHGCQAPVHRVRLGHAVRRRPGAAPDIYGKVGNSGVSIATLDDMKVLYDGFDLCSPSTSVSMTINGPAPTILAMFMNTAIDQQIDKFRAENKREPTADEAPRSAHGCCRTCAAPCRPTS
jgi:methylmalonyl-CoA mutase